MTKFRYLLSLAAIAVSLIAAPTAATAATTWKRVALSDAPSCPTGYIPVQKFTLPDGTAVPAFCVMKYEAKDGGNGIATSTAAGTPWVSITWLQASTACQSANARLISENEWLSIAHQVTTVATNWTGGAVGNGVLMSGHNDNAPANSLAASANDDDGYYGTGDTAAAPGDGGFNNFANNTINASPYAGQRRTLKLPNNQVIWDLAGNVWEWVGETIAKGNRYHGGTGQWMSYLSNDGAVSGTSFTAATNVPLNKRPPSTWNANQGMGRYYDGYDAAGAYNSVNEWPDLAGTGYVAPYAAFLRGGSWYHGAYAGVFALTLNHGRSYAYASVGFRCTR